MIAVITRYNKKTVSLLTEDGQRWNVAPQLLQRASKSGAPVSDTSNVIALAISGRSTRGVITRAAAEKHGV